MCENGIVWHRQECCSAATSAPARAQDNSEDTTRLLVDKRTGVTPRFESLKAERCASVTAEAVEPGLCKRAASRAGWLGCEGPQHKICDMQCHSRSPAYLLRD